jgi:hypothetical protein
VGKRKRAYRPDYDPRCVVGTARRAYAFAEPWREAITTPASTSA